MATRDGHLSIIFNGEIYNYIELRKELELLGREFISESDTEVLLSAWQVWGRQCLPRLRGMFAFAVVDHQAATLTCVRDPFGIKPLFWAMHDGVFCFASELPAVLSLRGIGAKLDRQTAYDYLVQAEYDISESSFVEGISQLEPGTLRVLDMQSGSLTTSHRWWSPPIDEDAALSLSDAADRLRQLFLDSVRQHLRSDVPLGAALSGGIDSSAVVCAMRHLEPDADIHTFSFIAAGSELSEESWIDVVNERVGARSHKVAVDPTELAQDLDDMIAAQGEPFGGTSIYAQYKVFKLARDCGITVTLDGQGADEMFGGYHGYPASRIRSMLDSGDVLGAIGFLRKWRKWPGRRLTQAIKLLVAEYAPDDGYQILREFGGYPSKPAWLAADQLREAGVRLAYPRATAEDRSRRRLAAELALAATRRDLPMLLRHADRNSMRFSVESRVPFVTVDMANFAFALPESYLVSCGGETKHILRAAMRGIVPDEILDRRDKIGFATPELNWLRQIRTQARAWIEDAAEVPFLKTTAMLEMFDRVMDGQAPFTWQIWRWINFGRWHRTVFLPLTA
jgi:asparagine synthase (glutamine-hydrolysing)